MSLECLITKQFSSRLFNCDIAKSKIFEYRLVKNRTIRYAAICYFGSPQPDFTLNSFGTFWSSLITVLQCSIEKCSNITAMRCFSMASVMCYVQVLFFKKLQKAVEHGGLIRTCGLFSSTYHMRQGICDYHSRRLSQAHIQSISARPVSLSMFEISLGS